METALAIDIGGTKLAAARVDQEGRVGERRSAPTPATGGAETIWTQLADLVGAVRRGDEAVVGVGCGGPMERGGVAVSPLNIGAWRGFPLRDRLARLTGLPVHVDNDAKALALGYGSPFFTAAQAELDARTRIEFARGARILPAGLGDAGPLVGAAAVGWRGEGHDLGVG